MKESLALPQIDQVTFEESPERLKLVMPLRRNWAYFLLYTTLILVWLVVTFWLLTLLARQPLGDLSFVSGLIFVLILLVWVYVWYRLGKHVLRYFGYYAATREILFINNETLIIRRPLSILGATDGYDMSHVSTFYYNGAHKAVAFDYGSRGGLFGSGLSENAAGQLIDELNQRYFSDRAPSDDKELFA